MKMKKRALALLLSMVMVLTFMPALAFAEAELPTETNDSALDVSAEENHIAGEQADEERETEEPALIEPAMPEAVSTDALNTSEAGEYTIGVNDKITVTASEDNSAVIMFDSLASRAYQINCYSEQATQIRLNLYESEPIDPENDSDGWRFIDECDFDDEEIEGIQVIDFEYPFLVDSDHTYKIELETAFDETDVEIEVELKQSDKAGIYNNFKYTTLKEYNDEGTPFDAIRIIKYLGEDKDTLVIPGSINNTPVHTIATDAVYGEFRKIVLNEGINFIEDRGITGSDVLEEVSLPSSLEMMLGVPFCNSINLNAITFPNGNARFKVENSMLIDTQERCLVLVFGGQSDEVTVPEGVKHVEGRGLENVYPKKVNLPKSLREVFRMPSTLEEMHIKNANCKIEYDGIPWEDYDYENDRPIYTVIVYAPAGGSVEQYCNENGITFIAEGQYDPTKKEPMSNPVALEKGTGAAQTATSEFDTGDGDYQEYTFTATDTGVYALNLDFSNVSGDINVVDAFSASLTDGNGSKVTALVDDPINQECCPGYLFYLTKGVNYTLRLDATDAAADEEFVSKEVSVYLCPASELVVNGNGWNDSVKTWDVAEMSVVFRFTAPKTGLHTITRINTSDYDEGDLEMFLMAENAQGSATIIKRSKQTFTANLTKGTVYYLAAVVREDDEASAEINVVNEDYDPDDPYGPVEPTDINEFNITFDEEYRKLEDITSTDYPDYFYVVHSGTILEPIVSGDGIVLDSDFYTDRYIECVFNEEDNEWQQKTDAEWLNSFPTDAGVYLCEVSGNDPYSGTYEGIIDLIRIEGHVLNAHAAADATCTKEGNTAYWQCSKCDKFFADSEGKTEIEDNSWVVNARKHDFGAAGYTWSDDNTQVTASHTCGASWHDDMVDGQKTVTETVGASGEVIKPATVNEQGEMKYTSEAFSNEGFEVQTKTVAIEKLTLDEAIAQAEEQAASATTDAGNADAASASSTNEEDVSGAESSAQNAANLAAMAEGAALEAQAAAQTAYDEASDDQKAEAKANLDAATKKVATAKKVKAAANSALATAKKAAAKVASNKAAAASAAAQSAATSAQAEQYRQEAAAQAAKASEKATAAENASTAANEAAQDLAQMAETADESIKSEIEAAKNEANTSAESASGAAGEAGNSSESAGQSAESAQAAVNDKANAEQAAAAAAAAAQPAEIIDLPAVKIAKPKAAKKKVTVKWKKVNKKNLKKIQGIEIRVTGPGVDKVVTAGKKKTSKKVGGLQSKQKYTVQVRAYAMIGGVKHVSAWKSKTVKVK